MTPENIRHNIAQEWDLSEEAWAEGEALRSAGLHRGSLTRYYYAAFHAARAALLSREVEPTTHGGTRAEFSRVFVHSGLIPREASRALASLQKEREDADYSRAFTVDSGDADDARDAASIVRHAVESQLRGEHWL